MKVCPVISGLVLNTVCGHLVRETPGRPDALLDIFDQSIAALEPGIVVQRGPDLGAHLLYILGEVKGFRGPAKIRS